MDREKQEIKNDAPDAPTLAEGRKASFAHLEPGTIIDGRYEVISLVGEGGCGSVYKVRQIVMKTVLALKTLNPSTSQMSMQRLQKEAQALSRLDHPNIVGAVDFGLIGDTQPFFAMEYVDGPTLAHYLKQVGRLSVAAMIELFSPVCMALAFAEKQGVVHRDIKPSNIILATDPESGKFVPKLVDFGIAKIQYGDEIAATLTKTGDIFGTPLYMSPEQCSGSPVDHRSDIYALGCVIFESLAGVPPFGGTTTFETVMQHTSAEVPSLKQASFGLEFPQAIEQILANMLAKKPADRYQTCDKVVADFQAFQANRAVESTAVRSSEKPVPKGKQVAVVGSVLVALVALVVAFSFGVGLHKPMVNLHSENATSRSALSDKTFDPGSSGFESLNKEEKSLPSPKAQYFSEHEGKKISFKFPEQPLGDLRYWSSPDLETKALAEGVVTVPQGAKLILFPAEPLLGQPALWTKFRPDDFYGIVLNSAQAVTADQFDDAVDNVLQFGRKQKRKSMDEGVINQAINEIDFHHVEDPTTKLVNLKAALGFDRLHLLALLYADFNDRTWSNMGTMPELRWLWLYGCWLNGKPAHGEDFLRLENLGNLRVLSLNDVEAPAPLFRQLSHSRELKRLSVGSTPISGEDLSAISKTAELDSLRLRELSLSGGASFAQLATAPHLERLSLNKVKVDKISMLSDLVKLKHLKQLVIDYPRESKEFAAIKVVPTCAVIPRTEAEVSWFDYTKENPDVTGLW